MNGQGKTARFCAVCAACAFLHWAFVSHARVGTAGADIFAALAVCISIGSGDRIPFGKLFVLGLAADVLGPDPAGFNEFSFLAIGWVAAAIGSGLEGRSAGVRIAAFFGAGLAMESGRAMVLVHQAGSWNFAGAAFYVAVSAAMTAAVGSALAIVLDLIFQETAESIVAA